MKIRLRRPRDVALALRDLARRRPEEAKEYLEARAEEWGSLAGAEPHNAADILEALGGEAAADLITQLEPPEAAVVLQEMNEEAAAELIDEISPAQAASIISTIPPSDAADVLGRLEPEHRAGILTGVEDTVRDEIRRLLAYPPDSAGGLMRTEVAALPIGITAGEAIEALRRLHDTLDELSYVYVVEDDGRLQGVISFRDLVFARPGSGLDEVMVPNPVAVRPDTDREEVAELIQRYNFFSLPVTDHRSQLLGIVTVEEALEAVQEEATEDIAVMVGAGVSETVYTPVRRSVRNRLPWIAVNLVIAFFLVGIISRFEDTIAASAVLAAYMPVVALVGGNGGAQSLAVVIRALALDDLPSLRVRRVILREFVVGLINGVLVATLAGVIAGAFTQDAGIGLVMALAALANMTVGGLAGASIPIFLRQLGLDPALASNIFLTTVTDLIGFGGFLAIAALLL